MKFALIRLSAFLLPALLTASAAQAQSAREIFERLKLLGTYSINCDEEVGPRNPYSTFRAIGTDHVRLEVMVGPKTRQFSFLIDSAKVSGSNDIIVSMANDKQRLHVVYRFEDDSVRTMDSMQDGGKPIIAEGRSLANEAETQWFNKCD